MEFRIYFGGGLYWRAWTWTAAEGGCFKLTASLWERMAMDWLQWRCSYTDGRAPSEYVALGRLKPAVNNGRCE
jgi:hypothetical protein